MQKANWKQKTGLALFFLFLFAVLSSGCEKAAEKQRDGALKYASFRDVPGITADEISAIEALQRQSTSFAYGATLSTEAFYAENGKIEGFTALFSDWLSEFFGIPFIPEIHVWNELIAGLESGGIDFTGELTATDERRKIWFMTDSIAERPLKAFQIEETDVFANLDVHATPGYESVSLSTRDPRLQPVISVVQKVLHSGGIHHLSRLYNRGYQDYARHRLSLRLTDEEKRYIRNNPVVRFAAERDNYPISFYDTRIKQWQGAALDILGEVESLTGLTFERVNDQHTEWSGILHMLENGEVAIVSDLIRSKAREGRFLWPDTVIMKDHYVLLSKSDYRDITITEIPYVTVGLLGGTAYATLFRSWFPNHKLIVEYESADKAFAALLRGEVDMVMTRETRLLDLSNYRELAGYKANIVFGQPVSSSFGINKDEVILCSIIDKALELIDTEEMSGKWTRKTYDYRAKLMQVQRPLLFGVALLLACVLALLSFFFLRKRNEGKRLETLVQKRTEELQNTLAQVMNLQKDLETAAEATRAASISKSRFLANMSHEMRTPLNAIIGLAEMELGSSNLDEDTFLNVEKIYSAGMNLLGIINDILDISKIESGRFSLVPVVYDVPSMINDTINLNIVRIGSKMINFSLHVDGSLPSRLEGDELRIKQIFNNLLSNAIKYTDAGSVDWSFSSTREGNRIKVTSTVRDTGKGISEEDQQKLFKDYFQTDLKANYYVEGTGLGLSITLNLIKLMGGTIKVESEFRKGSAFTVEFYQEIVNDDVIGDETAKNLSEFSYTVHRRYQNQKLIRVDMSYASILVVDDVVTNLDVARGVLKPYNINVDCVTSGREAIQRIREEKIRYDLIFMDHMMPGMDGIEAARIIREEIATEYAKTVPIVALTANALMGNDEIFLKNGFQSFLAKPIDILRLDQTLHQWVRNKEKEKKLLKQVKPAEAVQEKKSLLTKAHIPGLNIAGALPRFDNDEEFYLRILSSFVNNAPATIETVKNTAKDLTSGKNMEAYRIAVHSIKGSGRGVGADDLGNIAEKLENAAKQNDVTYIETHTEPFIKGVQDFIATLGAFLEKALASADKKPEKESPDPQLLAKLKEAAETYNMALLQNTIKTLSAFEYPSHPDLGKWLQEKAGKSDFEAIEKWVNALKG